MKKKALIKINRRNGGTEYINPSDIRTIVLKQSGTVMVNASHTGNNAAYEVSRWAIDNKLKPALRQRYNTIELENGRGVRKTSPTGGATNSIISIANRDTGDTTIVFPKGLVMVEIAQSSIKVVATGIPPITVAVQAAEGFTSCFDGTSLTRRN